MIHAFGGRGQTLPESRMNVLVCGTAAAGCPNRKYRIRRSLPAGNGMKPGHLANRGAVLAVFLNKTEISPPGTGSARRREGIRW
jgi:hypothetical protein